MELEARTIRQSRRPAQEPRRSFDAVRRFEALGIDPLSEAIALAQDSALPKPLRLKAWLTLCEYAYPKLAPVVPPEKASGRLEELQCSWDAIELDELKGAFRAEIGTLPAEVRHELDELDSAQPHCLDTVL